MRYTIALIILLIACSTVNNSKTNYSKIPLTVNILTPVPTDSLINFIIPYLRFKKIEVIERMEALELAKAEHERVAKYYMTKGIDSKTGEKIFSNTKPIVNSLNIKFYITNEHVDSLQWYIEKMPMNIVYMKNMIKHKFYPRNNNFYLAFKEFTDTLMHSQDLQ